MAFKVLLILVLSFNLLSCSKKETAIYVPSKKNNPYILYEQGLNAFEKNDFFYASEKFSEAEINFDKPELAAKSSIMASFSLYGINFYRDAIDNLERYLKTYPADKHNIYAHYLMAVIYYEQISDEKKDLKPLIRADQKIDFFLKKYPDSDYSIDLKFKKDLIQNQLAAKELYIARYYISVQKWIPAINRLKIIMNKYDKTIFIEEALHRLVEIHYYLGLENEAKKYVKILGYNYNSSEWFEQSYKILNRDYDIKKQIVVKKERNFFKKILNIFK